MRPILARISSAASGFFFCGMIEEPVENRSDSVTKRNCAEDQITSSSASRRQMPAQIEAAARNSSAKSRSLTHPANWPGRSKPSAAAVISRSMGKEVPASAARPSGHSFIRARASRRGAVAGEHLDIGHHVVAPGHRLRDLQMGEARHDPVGPGLGLREQRPHQRLQPRIAASQLVAHPEPEIRRHLVVARPRGVQPPAGSPIISLQPRLDIHVNVFQRGGKGEISRLDL
jgi:hypothetical protein